MNVSGVNEEAKHQRSLMETTRGRLSADGDLFLACVAAIHFKGGGGDVLAWRDPRRNGRGVGRFSRKRCPAAK
jgi:hypothetical protein